MEEGGFRYIATRIRFTEEEAAYYEYALMKQLQVNRYPTVFIQTGELKFVMVRSRPTTCA